MNYLMLLPLTVPVAIILFLVSALNKEERGLITGDEQTTSSITGNKLAGTTCHEQVRRGNKTDLKEYLDLSGGNLGI